MKATLLMSLFASGLALAQTPNAIKVQGGLVRGTAEGGLVVYRGIPFAAPPVGDLRWRAPQPVGNWDGVREAVKFGPSCVQGGGRGGPPQGSEDCLYLNVWTPA